MRASREILYALNSNIIVSAALLTISTVAAFEGFPTVVIMLMLGLTAVPLLYWGNRRTRRTQEAIHLTLMGDTLAMAGVFVLAGTGLVSETEPPMVRNILIGAILITSLVVAVASIKEAKEAIVAAVVMRIPRGKAVSWSIGSSADHYEIRVSWTPGTRSTRAGKDILHLTYANAIVATGVLTMVTITAFDVRPYTTTLATIGIGFLATTAIFTVWRTQKATLRMLTGSILIKAITCAIMEIGLIAGAELAPTMENLAIGGILLTTLAIATAGIAQATKLDECLPRRHPR